MTLIETTFRTLFACPKIPNPKLLLMNLVFAFIIMEERQNEWVERERKVIQKLVTKCKQNKRNEFDLIQFRCFTPFCSLCVPIHEIKMEHKLN